MNIDVYSTIAGALPRLVEKKEPMCFIPYDQFLEYKKEMEDELERVKGVHFGMLEHCTKNEVRLTSDYEFVKSKLDVLEKTIDNYRKLSLDVLMAGKE